MSQHCHTCTCLNESICIDNNCKCLSCGCFTKRRLEIIDLTDKRFLGSRKRG